MLDLDLFSNGTVRGATIAQIGTSIAMAGVMFGLILHFQYAYGWSPMRAGLANLPLIITMIAATPLSEWLARRFGHRIACLVGAGLLAGSLVGLAWGVEHGYLAIAVFMVVLTIGLRTVMTICAVALVDAMPEQPHLDRRRAQRHRAGGRHERRHRRRRHADRGPRDHDAAGRHLERRPGRVVLPRRADHLRRPGGRRRRWSPAGGALTLTDSRETDEHPTGD